MPVAANDVHRPFRTPRSQAALPHFCRTRINSAQRTGRVSDESNEQSGDCVPMAGGLLHVPTMRSPEETVAKFCEAWNRHDPADLAALWVEHGELNHPWGVRRVGREAILGVLAEEHAGAMADSALAVQRIEVQCASDKAFVDIDAVLTGVRAPNGRFYDLPHSISAMLVRSGDGWRIATLTPFTNPRQPH